MKADGDQPHLSETHLTAAGPARPEWRVPFLDLKAVNDRVEDEVTAAVRSVMASGRYLMGEQTEAFEREFAAWNGISHCVAVANGFDALRLCLMAWTSLGRLRPGDEVIVPANTFIATALAVTASGLEVRLADVDPETYNVSLESVVAAVTPQTRVIMPVHLYGQVADVGRIAAYCAKRGLLLLEDAAQAHGAISEGRHAGTVGHAGTFSFYPAKNLGACGDAGAVVTGDDALARRVRTIANYGSRQRYDHEELGVNSRMDEIQAAILRCKLGRLHVDNERRRGVARAYLGGIRNAHVGLPKRPSDDRAHVWHIFTITVDARSDLVNHLETRGIETLIHYPRAVHRQRAYGALLGNVRMPNAERLQHTVLSLPMSPVMSDEQIRYVVAAVNDWRGPGSRT